MKNRFLALPSAVLLTVTLAMPVLATAETEAETTSQGSSMTPVWIILSVIALGYGAYTGLQSLRKH